MIRARVVFPLPGGPEKITEGKRSASIARRKSFPGPRICSWPTNSSRERGRIRVASGAALSIFAAASGSSLANKSCTSENTVYPQILHQILYRRGDELTGRNLSASHTVMAFAKRSASFQEFRARCPERVHSGRTLPTDSARKARLKLALPGPDTQKAG